MGVGEESWYAKRKQSAVVGKLNEKHWYNMEKKNKTYNWWNHVKQNKNIIASATAHTHTHPYEQLKKNVENKLKNIYVKKWTLSI